MIDFTKVPPEEIGHPELAAAARNLAEVQQVAKAKVRELERLQDGRAEEQAKEQDARDALAGKKTRHLAAHRALVEATEHEARVSRLTVEQAHAKLREVGAEHGHEELAVRQHEVEVADDLWSAALSALVQLADRRAEAHRRYRLIGGNPEPVGMVRFSPLDVIDSVNHEPVARAAAVVGHGARERHRQRLEVSVDKVLDALQQPPEEAALFMPGGSALAARFKEADEHMRSVQRGISPDEANPEQAERRARAEDELRQAAHRRRMAAREPVAS